MENNFMLNITLICFHYSNRAHSTAKLSSHYILFKKEFGIFKDCILYLGCHEDVWHNRGYLTSSWQTFLGWG